MSDQALGEARIPRAASNYLAVGTRGYYDPFMPCNYRAFLARGVDAPN
jgi:hypothetical protein